MACLPNVTIKTCSQLVCTDGGTVVDQCLKCVEDFAIRPDGKGCILPAEEGFNAWVRFIVELLLVLIFLPFIGNTIYGCVKRRERSKKLQDAKANRARALEEPLLQAESGRRPSLVNFVDDPTSVMDPATLAMSVGALHHRFGLMRDWSIPGSRFQNFKLWVDVHMHNIMGVGLALFYDFFTLPMALAVGAIAVTGYATNESSYIHAVVEARERNYDLESQKQVVAAAHKFGSELCWGLFIYWWAMLLISWLHAYMSCKWAETFDSANSTMGDYAVQLDNICKHQTDEEKLLKQLNKAIEASGAQAFGISIGYDIRDHWEVNEMVERLTVEGDIELYSKTNLKGLHLDKLSAERHKGYVDVAIERLTGSKKVFDGEKLDEDWVSVKSGLPLVEGDDMTELGAKAAIVGAMSDKDLKQMLRNICENEPECVGYAYWPQKRMFCPKKKGTGFEPSIAKYEQKHPGEQWEWEYMPHRAEASTRFGQDAPAFGYSDTLADDFVDEKSKDDPCRRRREDEEKENLKQILNGGRAKPDGTKAPPLTGSGRAWLVFKFKSDATAVAKTFNHVWMEDHVPAPVTEDEKQMWLEALQPDDIGDFEKSSLMHIWPAGYGYTRKPLQVKNGDRVHDVPTGAKIKLLDNADFKDVKPGDILKIYRKIKVSSCKCEPPTVMWYSLGTPTGDITRNTFKAIGITSIVFVLIAALVYRPFAINIDLPYSKAQASPKEITNQTKGFLIGLANAVLGAVMGMNAWGVGFSERWKLDIWCSAFNMVTTLFNTVYTLGIYFWYECQNLREAFVNFEHNKDLHAAVVQEMHTSNMLYEMMVPGWLFIGFIVGQIVGFVVPWIQNFILLEIVFVCGCLGPTVNGIIAMIIPNNPDPKGKLSAREAEKIFSAGETSVCWEYADKIVTPCICLLSFFFLSPHMWRIFPPLLKWACFMYIYHRFVQIWIHKKSIHDSPSLGLFHAFLWFLPLGTIAVAWSFWRWRLGHYKSPVIMLFVFLTSTLTYWLGLYLILPSENKPVEKDKDYGSVKARLIYDWFNCNPVHLLKSRYGFLTGEVAEMCKAHAPFEFGKEYLAAYQIPWQDEELNKGLYAVRHIDKLKTELIGIDTSWSARIVALWKIVTSNLTRAWILPIFCILAFVFTSMFGKVKLEL